MEKQPMKKLAVPVLMLAAAFSAQAGSFEDYAHVVSVQEKYETTSQQPRLVCDNNGQPNANSGPGVGTVIGAVAGGLLGAQVGKGNGRTAAAAVGAVTGALTGNHLENSGSSPGQRCFQVADNPVTRVIGYNVTYEYSGRTFTEFSPTPPNGDSLGVRVNLMPVSH
jgi:uncharacterized protein YcfJ